MHRAAVEKVHSSLCIADMAFDINLLYLLKREGFRILEVPNGMDEIKSASKVAALGKTSFTMLLSVIRLALDIFAVPTDLRKCFAFSRTLALSKTHRAAAQS